VIPASPVFHKVEDAAAYAIGRLKTFLAGPS
jgi:hypothetical protein